MDTGEGRFMILECPDEYKSLAEKFPKRKGLFEIGEELEIKGSRFRIKKISVYGMLLKLLPAKD